ncbi:hypothetical protein P167DRAFT_538861 [Morchella conica CCBAS932]|uniref:Uncharacterized protein n=1 Tax=Morchella conica CCBAS932 TaxID=1392247 RepID=A0A3N4KSX9_9PEZI|nr:hypothetical protein P167DRAFT_538861 [Morchella conica CCBAS932]
MSNEIEIGPDNLRDKSQSYMKAYRNWTKSEILLAFNCLANHKPHGSNYMYM